ncbi:MAG: BatA domain-containing protein, partial [Planctomycetaceae bacterium]|nr:BatA domain-containing protein [Planctomycetaceae bacterium]
VPLFIHLIHRQNLREMPFPTLRFIRISEQKTRNKRRIQDLFLMLMRMAVLLLIAVGLAHPTIRHLSGLWGGAQTSAVLIVDNSASMAEIDGNVPRINTALEQAEKILDQLGSGDGTAIIIPCGRAFPENGQLFNGQDKVRKVLRDTKVSFEKANLTGAVQQAKMILEKANTPSKLIFVISDQQEISWQGQQNEPAKAVSGKIPLILVNCHQTPKPNVGLVKLDTKNVLPIAQVPLSFTVFLKNESSLEQTRTVEVYVNGLKQYTSPVIKIEPNGQASHPFPLVFDRGGLHKGEVRLSGTDGNPQDDKRYFAMEVDQGISVLLIKPMKHEIPFLEETYYIEKALQTGTGGVSPIRLTTINKEDLLTEPLQNYAAVIAVDIPVPEHGTAERLVQYVERGGNLIWTSGSSVVAEDYNRLNEEFQGKLLPAPLKPAQAPDIESGKDAWHIGTMDGTYPAFQNLVSPRELYTKVFVYRCVPPDVSQAGVPVLAALDDGTPLIVQKRVRAADNPAVRGGTITFIGTGVHVAWSNLPIRPIFVPMVNQLIFQLSGAEQTRLQIVAGEPLSFLFKDDEKPQNVEIIPPSGALLRRELKKMPDGKIDAAFVFEDTHQTGVYLMRPLETARQTQIPFSVNVDGEESDGACLTAESVKERFGEAPVVFANAGEELDTAFEQLKQGTSLWDIFLWSVLAVLVFEAFIANQFSQRKEDQERGVDVRKNLPRKVPSV